MLRALVFAFALAHACGAASAQEPKEHRLVIQVTDGDAARMDLALSNAANVSVAYAEKGEDVQIEIVAYGPGLHMLRADTSPVRQRVEGFAQSMPNVAFTACGNTMDTMKRAEGKDVPLLPKVKIVTAGVTRIMELQEEGWSYIRP